MTGVIFCLREPVLWKATLEDRSLIEGLFTAAKEQGKPLDSP